MRFPPHSLPLRVYVASVCAAGLPLLAIQALLLSRARPPLTAAYWLLAALLLLSDLSPIGLSISNRVVETTTSSTFALALLLGWGTRPAVVALGAASAIADLARRKAARKVAFNVAMLTISLVAAGAVYQALPRGDGFTARTLPAFAAAAIVFVIVNQLLIWGLVSCTRRPTIDDGVRSDLVAEAVTSAMLLAMAPVTLAVAQRSPWFVPLLLLPMVAVSYTSRSAFTAHMRRLRAEELLRAKQQVVQQLHDSDRLMRDLLGTVTHELRTPLTTIHGALATLLGRGDALDASGRSEMVALAMRQTQRLRELVEQLLLAAGFEHPTAEQTVPVDLAESAAAAALAARHSHPDLPVALAADGPLPARVAPELVLQLLASLLDNAAKHTPPGTAVRLEAFPDDQLAVLAVEDDGPGVPADQRHRVFDPFVQLDPSLTRPAGGIGLGLYIARRLARSCGGDLLAVPPRHGDGARFEFRLPLAAPAAPTAATPQS